MKSASFAVAAFFAFPVFAQTTLNCRGTENPTLRITAQMNGKTGQMRYQFEDTVGELVSGVDEIRLQSTPEEAHGNYLWEMKATADHPEISLAIRFYLVDSKYNGFTEDIKLYLNPDPTGFEWGTDMSCQIRQESVFL